MCYPFTGYKKSYFTEASFMKGGGGGDTISIAILRLAIFKLYMGASPTHTNKLEKHVIKTISLNAVTVEFKY